MFRYYALILQGMNHFHLQEQVFCQLNVSILQWYLWFFKNYLFIFCSSPQEHQFSQDDFPCCPSSLFHLFLFPLFLPSFIPFLFPFSHLSVFYSVTLSFLKSVFHIICSVFCHFSSDSEYSVYFSTIFIGIMRSCSFFSSQPLPLSWAHSFIIPDFNM